MESALNHNIEVRPVRDKDAQELALLLNEIIMRGGTTALEEPFDPDDLAETMLTGPDVICCFVAAERNTGSLLGFQSLLRSKTLPASVGDIATFTRIGLTQKGIGSALLATTLRNAEKEGLTTINATIRADNSGGLAFYTRTGFVDHSIQPAVPLKDGTPVNRIDKHYVLTVI